MACPAPCNDVEAPLQRIYEYARRLRWTGSGCGQRENRTRNRREHPVILANPLPDSVPCQRPAVPEIFTSCCEFLHETSGPVLVVGRPMVHVFQGRYPEHSRFGPSSPCLLQTLDGLQTARKPKVPTPPVRPPSCAVQCNRIGVGICQLTTHRARIVSLQDLAQDAPAEIRPGVVVPCEPGAQRTLKRSGWRCFHDERRLQFALAFTGPHKLQMVNRRARGDGSSKARLTGCRCSAGPMQEMSE